ncbi:MAG TPA: PAS domain S-box protein [Fimbriimonadaceae bacterium]|nr:PAS domain S-box protein [Fimbriimonadaceae bacterium]
MKSCPAITGAAEGSPRFLETWANEDTLRQIIVSMPVPMYATDQNGVITIFNDLAAAMWGREPEVGVDKWCGSWKIWCPDGNPMDLNRCPMAVTLRTGRPVRGVEIVIERPDGRKAFVLPHPQPLFDREGRIVGAINMLVDITEQKEAARRLQRYEQVFANSTEAISIISPDGQYLEQNAAHRLLTMFDDEDLTGRTPGFHMGDDVFAEVKTTLETEGRFHGELKSRHKGGNERDIELSAFAVRDEDGAAQCYVGIKRDITDRKRHEEALRNETRALETIQRIGLTLNSQLELQSIVQELTDASMDLIGAEFGSFYSSDGDERRLFTLSGNPSNQADSFPGGVPADIVSQTFKGGDAVRSDDLAADPRCPHTEGVAGVVSYLAVSVVSQSGEVIGGLFFGHSKPGVFTERHERLIKGIAAQAAIAIDHARLYGQVRSMNEDLEHRVRERTADLEAANEEMRGFTYSVSHDLRGPLRAIAATSRMLIEDYSQFLDADGRALLHRQVNAANKMGQLIDDLLKLSRLGRQELARSTVDLSALAELAAHPLATQYAKPLELQIEPGMEAVGDAKLLFFVFENLLSNAFKFAKEDEVLRLRVASTSADGERVFFVEDNGTGFDQEYASKVFLPFERLVRDDEYPGTGIGLANVKRIVERHGGKVWAESRPGSGASFFFTL